MKKIIIGFIALTVVSCNSLGTKTSKMEQEKIIELVLWKSKEGVSKEDAKTAIKQLNDFVKKRPGFIARKTALAEDGQFADIVFWTDLASAKAASEKVMQEEQLLPVFNTIDQSEMLFKHFEVFNAIP